MFFKILTLCAALEFGLVSGGEYNYQIKNKEWEDVGALYTSIRTYIKIKPFYIGGGMDCYFIPIDLFNYSPFQMTYIFNTGLDFHTVQIGYEHSCFHPMQPYSTIFGNEIKPKYEGGYNKFFIKIETK